MPTNKNLLTIWVFVEQEHFFYLAREDRYHPIEDALYFSPVFLASVNDESKSWALKFELQTLMIEK